MRTLHRHLCRPLPQGALIDALQRAPLRPAVKAGLLEVPTLLHSRADPIVEGAVARAVRCAQAIGRPDDLPFHDPVVLRRWIAQSRRIGALSRGRRRRHARLLAQVERGAERLERQQGHVASAWVRWIALEHALAEPDAVAVAGVGLGYRYGGAGTSPRHPAIERVLASMRGADPEIVASGYATPRTLGALDDAAFGRWVGRRATWLSELPVDHGYQWAMVGWMRALALRGAGGLLDSWCPPPPRHWHVPPAWGALPLPDAFFAGEACTRPLLRAAGSLPPEWDEALADAGDGAPSDAFLEGFEATAPRTIGSMERPVLRHFRFQRAFGGHANDADGYLAWLGWSNPVERDWLLEQLGVASLHGPQRVHGEWIGVSEHADHFELWVTDLRETDAGVFLSYSTTLEAWERCARLEQALADLDAWFRVPTGPRIGPAERPER